MSLFVTPQEPEIIGEVPFSVSARVAMQLGRESISNSIVGIIELVKNAYDADAEEVQLLFLDLDGEHPKLIIDDDGLGMDEETLVSNWLLIGTSNKLDLRQSKSKRRVLTGEKGLGRLGLDRLCQMTRVQSFTSGSASGIELDIDWRKYEDTDKRLESILHPLKRLTSKLLFDPTADEVKLKDNGTRLELYNLKDRWSDEAINRLVHELSLLISPFSGSNDFSIKVFSRGKYTDVDSSELLEAAEWKLLSRLNEDGYVSHEMTSRDGEKFEFSEKWRAVFPETKRDTPASGALEFVLYFVPRQAIEGLSFTRSQVDSFMDANQGVRIYRDNFRVKPYGDPSGEGDWLNLAYRRQQHPTSRGGTGWRVGYNQIVGAVFIERARNSQLLDQTNREGLVDSVAFTDLKIFAQHAVEWFERNQVIAYRAQNRQKRFDQVKQQATLVESQTRRATDNLETAITDAVAVLDSASSGENSPTLEALRDNLMSAFDVVKETVERTIEVREELTKVHEEEEQEAEEEKNTLHNLASLGILTVAFGHETLSHANLLVGNANLLKSELSPLIISAFSLDDGKKFSNSIDDLGYSAKRIHAFGNFLLRNMRRDKRKRVKVYLDKIIKDVLSFFDLEDTRNIVIDLDFPQKTPAILAFAVDWESILVNFITNSLWALRMVEERKIRIRLREHHNELYLSFADNGLGISKGTIDHIFEPTFTTKRNERGDKIGTGMGLAIVDDLVRSYGGKIHVTSPSDLGGAEFHIYIPIPRIADRGTHK